MTYDWLALASHGLIDLPWWGYIVVALALTHVTIAAVTIFLHRGQAHRALARLPPCAKSAPQHPWLFGVTTS